MSDEICLSKKTYRNDDENNEENYLALFKPQHSIKYPNLTENKMASNFFQKLPSPLLGYIFEFSNLKDLLRISQSNSSYRKIVSEKYLSPILNAIKLYVQKSCIQFSYLFLNCHDFFDFIENHKIKLVIKLTKDNKMTINKIIVKYSILYFKVGNSYIDNVFDYCGNKLTLHKNKNTLNDLIYIFISLKKITKVNDKSKNMYNLSLYILYNFKSLSVNFDIHKLQYKCLPTNENIKKIKLTKQGIFIPETVDNLFISFPCLKEINLVDMKFYEESLLVSFLKELAGYPNCRKIKLKNLKVVNKKNEIDFEAIEDGCYLYDLDSYDENEEIFNENEYEDENCVEFELDEDSRIYQERDEGYYTRKEEEVKYNTIDFTYNIQNYHVKAQVFKIVGGKLKNFKMLNQFLAKNNDIEKLVLQMDKPIGERSIIGFLKELKTNKDSKIKIIKLNASKKFSKKVLSALEEVNKSVNRNITLLSYYV